MKSIHVLRKPCSEPTVTANVLKYGTGGINVDATRIAWASPEDAAVTAAAAAGYHTSRCEGKVMQSPSMGPESRDGTEAPYQPPPSGRWPANLVLGACIDSELDEVFPHNKAQPVRIHRAKQQGTGASFSMTWAEERTAQYADNEGSAARYFKRVSE